MADPVVFKNGKAAWSTATGSDTFTQITGVKSVEIPFSKAELPDSVMGDTAEVFFPGIISAPITVVARQDFSTGGLDSLLWTRWSNETKFQFEAAPVNTTLSTSNPAYRFNRVFVSAYSPLSGAHGVALDNTIQLRMLTGCTVTRQTASSS